VERWEIRRSLTWMRIFLFALTVLMDGFDACAPAWSPRRAEPSWYSFPPALDRSRALGPVLSGARDALTVSPDLLPHHLSFRLSSSIFGSRDSALGIRSLKSEVWSPKSEVRCAHAGMREHSKRGLWVVFQECVLESCSNGPDPTYWTYSTDNWSGKPRGNKSDQFLPFKLRLLICLSILSIHFCTLVIRIISRSLFLSLLPFAIFYFPLCIWYLIFDIWHLTFDIWHLTFGGTRTSRYIVAASIPRISKFADANCVNWCPFSFFLWLVRNWASGLWNESTRRKLTSSNWSEQQRRDQNFRSFLWITIPSHDQSIEDFPGPSFTEICWDIAISSWMSPMQELNKLMKLQINDKFDW
jgi:hypothetical protein